MPPANKAIEAGHFLRAFIYGQDKTKKTWWALKAAEAGFNVVLLDCDGGSQIVNQIDEKARERIMIVDIVDTLERAVAAEFIAMFLREANTFTWDEDAKQFTLTPNPKHAHLVVDAKALDKNTVLVLDSWTALAASTTFRYALEQRIDLSDADKTDWDGYGWQGRFLTFVLMKLKALRCHVIVIGHETTYEKRAADGKTIVWSKTVPVSSSNNHALTIGKNFNDVLRFRALSSTVFKIEASASSDSAGGSRALAPTTYDWAACPPEVLFKNLGVFAPEDLEPQTAFRWFAPGEVPEIRKPNIGMSGKPTLSAANAKPISVAVDKQADDKPAKPSLFAKK